MSLFSSTNGKDLQDETSLTLEDILEIHNEWGEESAAVLGGSDEKCCTYPKGYIKRQALYSCLTCCPEGRTDISKCAGVCLACSYQCHENHELIEMYTKRNFRCDCPTKRISNAKCSFTENNGNSSRETNPPGKFEVNAKNLYSQNFTGLYCTCKRPYPDPDSSNLDEMVQCTICEDWYHTQHLQENYSECHSYAEVICETCVKNHPFLQDYAGIAVNKIEKSSENGEISVDSKEEEQGDGEEKDESDKVNNEKVSETNDENFVLLKTNANEISEENEPECKKKKLNSEATTSVVCTNREKDVPLTEEVAKPANKIATVACIKPSGKDLYSKGSLFWGKGWRDKLCRCVTCMKMYESYKCTYLLDEEDTIKCYEEKGIKKFQESESDYEQCVQAFSGLDHVQKIRFATGYSQMVEKLKEYLQPFRESQTVITERDIREIFERLKREKPSLDEVDVPHFCR